MTFGGLRERRAHAASIFADALALFSARYEHARTLCRLDLAR
jgi:hypothetical protein